jgi:MFS family permease
MQVTGLGALVVTPIVGNLSDRYGRKALMTLPVTVAIAPLCKWSLQHHLTWPWPCFSDEKSCGVCSDLENFYLCFWQLYWHAAARWCTSTCTTWPRSSPGSSARALCTVSALPMW